MLGSCEYQYRQFSWPLGYRIASGLSRVAQCPWLGPAQRAIGTVSATLSLLRPRVSLSSNCIVVLPAAISPGWGRSDLVRQEFASDAIRHPAFPSCSTALRPSNCPSAWRIDV